MAKHIDLAKLFGVEGLVTLKTLTTEKLHDIKRKTANEAGEDIRALLDEVTVKAVSQDIVGVIECLNAIQLRLTYMQDIAENLRKQSGK